jgi:hypothetical protein
MEINGHLHALTTLIPRKRTYDTGCIEIQMDPRAVLNDVVKRKFQILMTSLKLPPSPY